MLKSSKRIKGSVYLGGGFKHSLFSPRSLEEMIQYFSHGLVQPPTRNGSVFYDFVGVNFDAELSFEQIRTAMKATIARSQCYLYPQNERC